MAFLPRRANRRRWTPRAMREQLRNHDVRKRCCRGADCASEAGFSHVRQIPIDDPFNNLYELTP